jgi:hypothetical protein
MKKISMVLAGMIMMSAAHAEYLDIGCGKQVMVVNGVQKDVFVKIHSDYKNYQNTVLEIYTKPANSPSYRSHPVPADAVEYSDSVTLPHGNPESSVLFTQNKIDGYRIQVSGALHNKGGESTQGVGLTLVSIGNPSIKINGNFDCETKYDW